MDNGENTFNPPYNIAWATFHNTVEKVASDLPNKVDRSYLGSASGSIKSYLISAFKSFGLIDGDHQVTDRLRTLATEPDQRPQMIADMLRSYYPLAVSLGETNATPGELDTAFAEMFPSVTGESRVKAIRFYLSASDFAGLAKSPLWKSPKAGATGARRGRPRKVVPDTPPPVEQQRRTADQSLRQFPLASGRTLTISLDGDVLALERAERKFVMEIVDQIEEYVEQNPAPTAPKVKAAPEPEEAAS